MSRDNFLLCIETQLNSAHSLVSETSLSRQLTALVLATKLTTANRMYTKTNPKTNYLALFVNQHAVIHL